MNSRERVRMALSHQSPDRVPIDFGGTFLTSASENIQKQIVNILGLKGQPDSRFEQFDDRIQKYFGCDLRSMVPKSSPDWGFDWKELHKAPLKDATINDLKNYPWPEPDEAMVEGLEQEAQFLHKETDYFICASQIGQGIFELGCYLRGYEKLLLDTAINKDFVHAFNQEVLEANLRLGELYFGVIGPYVDMVLIGDDLATQKAPYISPDTFRELFKPYFKEYISSIKKCCPDAITGHHCCGNSFRLLDDLADIGIEVINPVQTRANEMTPENLVTKKDRLSFLGGVDLQYILPHGTAQEVEQFVKNLINLLGQGGGYILAPCHTLPDDVKPENVITMLETALKCGKYPLAVS